MNSNIPYTESELDVLLHEPWDVRDQPIMLHAAFALSTLFDVCAPETEEDDEEPITDDLWSYTVPKNILDRLVQEIATDFNDAAKQGKPIKIWGKSYSIRKVQAYNPNVLIDIFNFPLQGDEYIITKTGVLNLAKTTLSQSIQAYDVSREEAANNRTYLRQIIKLAEDDSINGWDKLTDMEIALYCWGLFFNKTQSNNLLQFQMEYKDYLYVTEADMRSCYNTRATLLQRPNGMYAFSRDKVLHWNKVNNQPSIAITIPKEEADDYWYEKALKTTFKITC